jgi:hypothetical protein
VYNRKGLSYYDYKGNFIKRELLPFNFKNFRIIPDGFLFIIAPNQNNHLKAPAGSYLLKANFNLLPTELSLQTMILLNYPQKLHYRLLISLPCRQLIP